MPKVGIGISTLGANHAVNPLGNRQTNQKGAPLAGRTVYHNITPVRLDNPPDDSEPQTGAGSSQRFSVPDTGEFIEDLGLKLRGDADSGVAYDDLNGVFGARAELDPDLTFAIGKLQGIAHKVDEYLLDAFRISFAVNKTFGSSSTSRILACGWDTVRHPLAGT